MRWRYWKVDWPNHLIAFFSALFGILIAFELEDWRESRNNQDDARNAFDKIKQEIQVNKNGLHEALSTNLKLIGLLEEEIVPLLNDRLEYSGLTNDAVSLNSRMSPIAKIILSDTTTSLIKGPVLINMGSLLQPTLHNSAWESAKATGIINYIEYEKVLSISYLYNIPRITDELQEIKMLIKKSDEVASKSTLKKLLSELKESHFLIESELANYDIFVNITLGME